MGLTKTASAKWTDGLHFEGAVGSGNTLAMDGEAGPNGFSPMELLVVGLAGCTGMDVIDILRKKRQAVTEFEVNVRGDRHEEHPKCYSEMFVEYVVRGHHIDPKAVERSIELSQTKYCSVSATLAKGVKITTSYRIEETEAEPELALA